MTLRLVKCLVALCVAGLAGLYAIQNLYNLGEARGFIMAMLSQPARPAYPSGLIPPIDSPLIAGVVLAIIILTELAAACFAAIGAWEMYGARENAQLFATR